DCSTVRRRRHVPPQPLSLGIAIDTIVCGFQATRVERFDRTRRHQSGIDLELFAHAYDEKAGTGLRHEERGVNHQRAITVAVLGECLADRLEVFATVAGKRPGDVLERHDSWRTAFCYQQLYNVPE